MHAWKVLYAACTEVNRMPRNRLPRVMEHYSPTGRGNHGRPLPLKRLMDTWGRNGSKSGTIPWQIYDDDDDDDRSNLLMMSLFVVCFLLGNSPAPEFYMPTFRNTLSHLHRRIGILHTCPPMKMEQTERSETSAYKIQTPGNYPEESIQHSENGESLKSRTCLFETCRGQYNCNK